MGRPDFDAGSIQRPPIRLRLAGKTWTLPGALPAAAAVRISRIGRRALTGQDLIALIDDIVPRPTLDAWCAAGVTLDQLLSVSAWLVEEYTKGRRR